VIYTTLILQIQTTLQSVTSVKAIYPYPATKIEKYPAVIFFPDALENAYETTQDNRKNYRFKMFVVVGSTQKDKVDIFSTVLPKAVDAVIDAFDSAWNGGTIDGHRVSVLINSGSWSMGVTNEGLEAQAELTVEFRFLTSI
jgi:hypothetical protein